MTEKNKAILHIMDDPIVTIDLMQHLIGDYIGCGQFRYVFDYTKGAVIKIDIGNVLANSAEWHTWVEIEEHPDVAKWFAPVIRCSEGGKLLIMQKADMNRPIEDYPTEIPDFFCDVKKQNFGFIGKQLVCVDYAINNIRLMGMKNFKLKKVNWFGGFNK